MALGKIITGTILIAIPEPTTTETGISILLSGIFDAISD